MPWLHQMSRNESRPNFVGFYAMRPLIWLAPFAVALAPMTADAQAPDTVEVLRQALKHPSREPAARDQAIREGCAGLHGIPEMRRALLLQEWRDGDADATMADVDRVHRQALVDRFQAAVRQALASGEASVRLAAIDMLADLGGRASATCLTRGLTGDLVALTEQGPAETREAAARALGQISPDLATALPALARLLDEKEEPLRQAAATGLAAIMREAARKATDSESGSDPRVGQELVGVGAAVLPVAGRAASDASAIVRRRAVEVMGWAATAALGQIADPRNAEDGDDAASYASRRAEEREALLPLLLALKAQGPVLAQTLRDADAPVRARARRALEIVGEASARWRNRFLPESPAGDDPLRDALRVALPSLVAGLHDPDRQARQSAVTILESLDKDAFPAGTDLAHALADPDRFIRWAAARTLGKIAPNAAQVAVPALIPLVADADLDLRLTALGALYHYGPAAAPAIAAVEAALKPDNATDVRLAALAVLGQIDSAAAIPGMTAALSDPHERVREAAARTLGHCASLARPALPALDGATKDPSLRVRRAATEALLQIASGS